MQIDTIINIIQALVLVGGGIGTLFALFRWIEKQNRQDKSITELKAEQTLICYALSACLDGLQQLGANHTVPIAKEKLEKHLNIMAHK